MGERMDTKKVLTVADVKCYYCGHVSGEMTVEKGKPPQSGWFVPGADWTMSRAVEDYQLRCVRCNGPVYLDEVRTVYPRPRYTQIRPRPIRSLDVSSHSNKGKRGSSRSKTGRPTIAPVSEWAS